MLSRAHRPHRRDALRVWKAESGHDRDRAAERRACRVDAFVNEKALSRVCGDEGGGVISLAPGTKVFLACRPVDLRNGFDGLAAKVQQVIGADPFSGHLFIFRGKRGDYLKACTGTAAGCG